MDADLRKPGQHEIWGLSNERGLTTMMLEAGALAEPPIQSVDIPGLSIITSGQLPPIPTDLLGSRKMDEIIGVLKARAEIVLFDAPPVLAVSDAGDSRLQGGRRAAGDAGRTLPGATMPFGPMIC